MLPDDQLLQTIRALPKIELHRHLEGSFRLDTMVTIAEKYGIEMPEYDTELLRPFVQMMPNETRNAQHFLGKFMTIRQFFRSPEVIQQATREAIADAAADNVKYMELRFTPRALSNILQCSYYDVVSWVCDATEQACLDYPIQVRLIVSMNRHESPEIGEHVLAAAVENRHRGVTAIDLAGNEQQFSAEPFRSTFYKAKELGLGVTVHAGEWGEPSNIRQAVEELHADRIGHGVRAYENPELVDWLVERGTVLELCPTSNVHSGVVADWNVHPLQYLFASHVRTTINTDDPLISNIVLSDELCHAVQDMQMTLDDVKRQTITAAQSAFLSDDERAALVRQFTDWLS